MTYFSLILTSNLSLFVVYHSAKDADEVAAGIAKQHNTTVEAWQCDVSKPDVVKKTFAAIDEKMGPVHGVVANAVSTRIASWPRLRLTRLFRA